MAGLKRVIKSIKTAAKKARDVAHKIAGIDPSVPPSGTGCVECLAGNHPKGAWWLHLRRCAECGHIGCCDDSPNMHATGHFHETGHPVIQSFEPGEDWFYDYLTKQEIEPGVTLKAPTSHPTDQPVPFNLPKLGKAKK